MRRRQFVKTMGAIGLAGLYPNTKAAEAAVPVPPLAEGAMPQFRAPQPDDTEINDQIRREKFDTVLPEAMKKNNVDMWIYVMRETIPDLFGAQDLGSTSGVFVFTDRGGGRIERAVLERRWGASFTPGTWPVTWDTRTVETCGAYDIVEPAVLVKEPSGPHQEMEYDLRFNNFRKFVEERDPKRIGVNFKLALGPYATSTKSVTTYDGLSCTDYLLLTKALGPKYSARLVSSEYVMMDYLIRKVPTEIAQLKAIRLQEDDQNKKLFAAIVPGVTKNREVADPGTYGQEHGVTVFRREAPGISQRGRTPGYENLVIEGGDIIAMPSQGTYGYVLRRGETEPPPEIKKLWERYRKVDEILMDSIKVGLTTREIVKSYTPKFEAAGFEVRDEQLQLASPPDDFPAYQKGSDPTKTIVNIDCHGMAKGAQKRKYENYLGPRIGSNGPLWAWDIPLPPYHHHVMEYFIYMPWPSTEYKDQYLFFWDHEQVLVHPDTGIQYLSPMKKELVLISS
jgi:hypothetical protein